LVNGAAWAHAGAERKTHICRKWSVISNQWSVKSKLITGY
jgi:hypothetical protein